MSATKNFDHQWHGKSLLLLLAWVSPLATAAEQVKPGLPNRRQLEGSQQKWPGKPSVLKAPTAKILSSSPPPLPPMTRSRGRDLLGMPGSEVLTAMPKAYRRSEVPQAFLLIRVLLLLFGVGFRTFGIWGLLGLTSDFGASGIGHTSRTGGLMGGGRPLPWSSRGAYALGVRGLKPSNHGIFFWQPV